ncbi:MAG: hypothetical protein JNL98_11620 [Bryobacterales bacterium]|nr:hypothetical protein [Bryobacterales bacterium]
MSWGLEALGSASSMTSHTVPETGAARRFLRQHIASSGLFPALRPDRLLS